MLARDSKPSMLLGKMGPLRLKDRVVMGPRMLNSVWRRDRRIPIRSWAIETPV